MTTNNPYLIERLAGIQQSLMAQFEGSKNLPSAMKGVGRETLLREFFQQLFPAHRRFSNGVITDSVGNLSGQIDIAIEYGHLPSFPMPKSDERLILAESVAFVIEVKSDLSSQWGEVENTTRSVKRLQRTLNPTMITGTRPSDVIPVVAVGYKGHKTIDGLIKRLESTPPDARPDAALVIDSGCFVGYDLRTNGPLGLYALAHVMNVELNKVLFTAPDILRYVDRRKESPSSDSDH